MTSAACCCSRVATKLPLGLREVEERGLADIGDSLFVLGPALVHAELGFIHSGVPVHKGFMLTPTWPRRSISFCPSGFTGYAAPAG